ncbi:MFS transporter [Levilactobacillus bambusae]|uniref:MFS transporter n=1 Tax=Levilactobacillus bambusae TaxID=2024736 RepID=A0A2V1MZ73_9LACO|nr:MFS transporter [Levilactobacillus bambusae]PWG00314.1 MFS transporter [Levilactobacillus bambusae]
MGTKFRTTGVPLIISPFASQLGTAVYLIGLDWLLVQATGTTKLLGIIQGIGGISFLFGDILVGGLVDHYNRKRVLVWTDIISALACILGGLLVNNAAPQTGLLIMITLVLNLMVAINFPAAKSIIPEVIPSDRLQRFNAASNTLFSLANIFSPIVGGTLLAIKQIDFTDFMLFNATSFILAAVLNSLIIYPHPHSQPSSKAWYRGLLTDTIEGLKYVFRHGKLVQFMFAMGIFNFIYAGFLLLSPYVGKHNFGGHSINYSLFLTVSAIGGIIGGLRLMFQTNRVKPVSVYREQLIYAAVLILGGTLFNFWTWLLIGLTYGIVQSRLFGSITTFIQDATDDAYMGRIFGLMFLCYDGIQPVGSLLFGGVIPILHHWTYIVLGLLALVAFSVLIRLDKKTG